MIKKRTIQRTLLFISMTVLVFSLLSFDGMQITSHADESEDASKHLNIHLRMEDAGNFIRLVEYGEVLQDNFPNGISYDAENAVLTLDNYKKEDARLMLSGTEDVLTIRLVGENTLLSLNDDLEFSDNDWLRLTGDGILNLYEFNGPRLIMDSGTLNVKLTNDAYNKYGGTGYAITNRWFRDLEDGDPHSCYKFLGGEVNIDCTEKLEHNGVRAKEVGIDVQSGDVEIRNSKVHINLGDNKWLGLGVGWAGDKIDAGKLTMENGTLEIISADYQAYLFEFENEGDPLHFYVGTDGPEKEVTFEEACPLETKYGLRHECRSEGKGYLLITNEPVETVDPVTPSPEPTEPEPIPSHSDNCPSAKFVDMKNTEGKWFHNGVDYALTKGYMAGVSKTQFDPDGKVTRAQVAQILYAAEGKPSVKNKNRFTDVVSGEWYADAVNWAAENSMVTGYGNGKFGPNDNVTREQLVAIMMQYSKVKGYDLTATADLGKYSDRSKISSWALTAVKWGVAHGVISGTDVGIEPKGNATRAQIAVILQAYDNNIRK